MHTLGLESWTSRYNVIGRCHLSRYVINSTQYAGHYSTSPFLRHQASFVNVVCSGMRRASCHRCVSIADRIETSPVVSLRPDSTWAVSSCRNGFDGSLARPPCPRPTRRSLANLPRFLTLHWRSVFPGHANGRATVVLTR